MIGVGHSCGALLQTLITSLFPDTPRAVNILISFNNRPAAAAIPAFNEVVIPLSEQLMGKSLPSPLALTMNDSPSAASNATTVNNLRESIAAVRTRVESLLDLYAQSPVAPEFVANELLPLYRQSMEIVDQVPDLLQSIANGKREFSPSPADTKEACR